MAESFTLFFKEHAAVIGDNLRKLIRILAEPEEFISSVRHSSRALLLQASIFAGLVSLLNLAIHIPLFRFLGVSIDNVSYFIVDTILTCGFWLLYASVFHVSARILRGKGTYVSSLVSYLYMTAFFPLMLIVSIPAEAALRRNILSSADIASYQFLVSQVSIITTSNILLISLVLVTLVWGWYLVSLTKVFRIVHKVGRIRAGLIVLLGLILWMAFSTWVEAPAFQMLWRSYEIQVTSMRVQDPSAT